MTFLPNIKASFFSYLRLFGSSKKSSLARTSNTSGQALLVVVLIMAVSLVVVLSISTRSTSNITETSYNENALRAFSAAEAGVEEALLKNTGTGGSPVVVDPNSNVSYSSVVQPVASTDTFEHPETALSGQSRTFWFVSHAADGRLTCDGLPCTKASQLEVCWGTGGTDANSVQTPAVEVTMYYDDTYQVVASPNNYANVKTYRYTADPSASRRGSNNFGTASTSCSFGNYAFSTGTLNLSSTLPIGCATSGNGGCMTMAKVRLLYNTTTAHPVGLQVKGGNALLPSQGIQVDSTGTAGDSTRKVSVFRSFAEPQSVFDAGVFSYNDLTK